MKRTERHHLKADGFVAGLNRFVVFAKRFQKEMLTAAGVLLILAAAYALVIVVQAQQARKQSRILGEIISLTEGRELDETALGKLKELSGRGRFARVGYLHLAGYWMERGDLDQAQSYAARVSGTRRDLVSAQARLLQARIHVLRSEYEPALEIYRRLEREKPRGFPLDAVLFEYAETLEKTGEKSLADDLYRRLAEEYAQTFFGYEATLKLNRPDFR